MVTVPENFSILKVDEKISSPFQTLRHPSDKARKHMNIGIFRALAKQPGGMQRRIICEVYLE